MGVVTGDWISKFEAVSGEPIVQMIKKLAF